MQDIDILKPERHLIDLEAHSSGDFGYDDHTIDFVFDDIILVELIDVTEDGNSIMRNGIAVPINTVTKAWRKGRVLLTGPNVKYTVPDDIVIFPNDKGIPVARFPVVIDGEQYTVKHGIFLNEDRLFGKCRNNESISSTA